MIDAGEARLYQIFEEIGITDYEIHEHQAVFTIAEIDEVGLDMPGLNLKNLLIKDKKDNQFYMVILDDHRHMDMKHFQELTGWSKKVRFANEEELMELLHLAPGSVSPFGIIHDRNHQVVVVLGREITAADEDALVNFHSNRNTATLSLKKSDFLRFLRHQETKLILEE